MGEKKVLIGGFSHDVVDALKGIHSQYDFYFLTNEDENIKVSDVLVKTESIGEPLDIKIVLLNGLSREEIYAFIENYKKLGLPKALFAMITQHSINWTLRDLIYHLIEEEKEMRKR